MAQLIRDILLMLCIGTMMLLLNHVDNLTFELAQAHAWRAAAIMEKYEGSPPPQAEAEIQAIVNHAKGLCLGAFIVNAFNPTSTGRCTEAIRQTTEAGK